MDSVTKSMSLRKSVMGFSIWVLRAGLVVATAFLSAESSSAVECVDAQNMLKETQQAGFQRLLVVNTLSIGDSEARKPDMFGGTPMSVRAALEIEVKIAQEAVTFTQGALARGEIQPGGEHAFIVKIRRLLYLSLKEHGAGAGTMGLLAGLDGRGIILRRVLVFPNDARDGEMKVSGETCVQDRLSQVYRWPDGRPVSAAAILQGPETPHCKSLSDASFPCASLSRQLELATADKEVVFATARGNGSIWVFTLSPAGKGRTLLVFNDGTAFLTDQYFDANVEF